MTHFSRTTIAKIVQENKEENKISKEEFLLYHLHIPEEDYEALLYKKTSQRNKHSLEAIIDQSIEKALDYGCTIRLISNLFKVSNTTIYNLRSSTYGKTYKKNKIVIEGDEIIISTYKKK